MKMAELPAYVTDLLDKIAVNEGYTSYTLSTESGSNHGDNFCGIIARVNVRGTRLTGDGQPTNDELNLLCKYGSDNPERQKEFQFDILYGRELYVYETVLPALDAFQEEKGLDDNEKFRGYAKFYGGIADAEKGQFVLIFEDLKFKQCEMWPKERPVRIDHVRLMLEELGKLHGVSFAMKDQQPDKFEPFKRLEDFLISFLEKKAIGWFHSAYDMAAEVVDDERHLKLLRDVKENTIEYVKECVDTKRFEPFGVINHGDSWNNNLLYQYEHEVALAPAQLTLVFYE